MITCIAKLKDGRTIADAAIEVWELLGKGGNPNATQIEEYVGWVNTPVVGEYFRTLFDDEYIPYLQGIKEIDGAESCEVILIEIDGQTTFEVGDELLGYICGVPLKIDEVD